LRQRYAVYMMRVTEVAASVIGENNRKHTSRVPAANRQGSGNRRQVGRCSGVGMHGVQAAPQPCMPGSAVQMPFPHNVRTSYAASPVQIRPAGNHVFPPPSSRPESIFQVPDS